MPKLTRIAATNLAGYEEIVWDELQPGENLLVGRNGAGKSTLLEAIVVGLNFINGKRSGDLLTGANLEAYLHLDFVDGSAVTKTLGEIRRSQTPVGSQPVENVLYVNEARRPKSRFGRPGRNALTQHPTRRYEYVLSELQLLQRGEASERDWVQGLLERASRLKHAWHPKEWDWISSRLPVGTQGAPRPMSCGQYDVLSFLLDIVRTREATAETGRTPYVILDNPDALLHPALQEEVLDLLHDVLPDGQFFIGTHSLKLLARARPSSVFWLSRDLTDDGGRVVAAPVRDLAPDTRGLFFELYGHDTSSAVLAMALGLESTEYLAFLCASALPCQTVERPEPVEKDAQVRAILDELRGFAGSWTLLDVGAGAGDLLLGAERLGIANREWHYVAVEHEPNRTLQIRLDEARDAHRIAPDSQVVSQIAEAPPICDAVVFANTCHALGLERLAEWLAAGLSRLRDDAMSRLVIHETEVLRHGEHGFLMWTPEEYLSLFAGIAGITATRLPTPKRPGVPIHTVVARRVPGVALPTDMRQRLQASFESMLLPKLTHLLRERTSLESPASAEGPLREALRQRRRAFLTEQCANISLELQRLGRLAAGMEATSPST